MSNSPINSDLDALLNHGRWVRALAHSLVADSAAAEDVAQKTWLAVLEKPPGDLVNPRGWLGGVVRNIAGTHWRKQHRQWQGEAVLTGNQKAEEPGDEGLDQPDFVVDRMETIRKLAGALTELREPYRRVLYLRFFEELTIREIAKRMGVPESTTHARIHRGLELMRSELASSIGLDWRQCCLAFTVPLTKVAAGSLSTAVIMTLKTKILIVTAAALSLWGAATVLEDEPSAEAGLVSEIAELHAPGAGGSTGPVQNAVIIRSEASPVVTGDLTLGSGSPAQIIDSQGAGVAGAHAIAWKGLKMYPDLIADKEGWISFPEHAKYDGVAILADDLYPAFFEFHTDQGRQQFQFPAGLSFSGRVDAEGTTIEELPGFTLNFPQVKTSMDVPNILMAHLDMGFKKLRMDANGYFELQGLPEDWQADMRLPNGWLLRSYHGPGSFHVPSSTLRGISPADGIHLGLVRSPGFRGRVVTPDGEEGVGQVDVLAFIDFESRQDNALFNGAMSKRDGTFFIAIIPSNDEELKAWCLNEEMPVPTKVEVVLRGNEEFAKNSFTLDLTTQVDPWFLGDLSLREASKLRILARDESGAPISGAFAVGESTSKQSGPDGLIQVVLGGNDIHLKVLASGYLPHQLETSSIENGTTEVTLVEAATLTCSFKLPEGVSSKGLVIKLRGNQGLFGEPLERQDINRIRMQSKLQSWRGKLHANGEETLRVAIRDNSNEIQLWGFKSQVPIACQLEGPMGEVLAAADDLVFTPGEKKTVEFQLSSTRGALFGFILDDDGNAIPNANVTVRAEGGFLFCQSKDDGSFRFDWLPLRPLHVESDKRGYAPFIARGLIPTESISPLHIRLETPRNLDVFFVDPTGDSVPGGRVFYTQGFSDRTVGDAQHITDVPLSAFEMYWRTGGLDGKVLVPANVTEYVVQVPAMGSVSLRVTRKPNPDFLHWRFILDPINDDMPEGYRRSYSHSIYPNEAVGKVDFPARVTGKFRARVEFGNTEPQSVIDLGMVEILEGECLNLEADLRDK